jgi:hypothetical protein
MSTSRSSAAHDIAAHDGIQRCRHTLLTKPECHCRACLLEQIATYGNREDHGPLALPLDVERAAA